MESPRRKRNSVGGFLSSPIKLKDNSNYDDASSSSSNDGNNNFSKKKQEKISNHKDGAEREAPGGDFLNFYYDDEEVENGNIVDDYNLTEREWLQILEEEEDFFDNGEDSSNNISLQQGSDDLEKELFELEKSLLVGKNRVYDKDEDFWMTGKNITLQENEKSKKSSSDTEAFDKLPRKKNYPFGSRADLSVSKQNITKPEQALSFTEQTPLERALLQGVVPADAGVGSRSLPGDYGFDPLGLSAKDLFPSVQKFLLKLLPPPLVLYNNDREEEERKEDIARPKALIIRDFREAEIRHGRLAMLAAVIWPLQELIDRAILPVEEYTFTIIYGEGTTLPFLVLLMTLIMMLLGYLDIFASQIRAGETGDAFLPGECFWDPLSVLDGAQEHMKRRMQERELMNGRIAMVAVALYALQEAITHRPLIELQWNQMFFEPVYQIPAIRQWLDHAFGQSKSPTFLLPDIGEQIDFVDIANEVWKEEVEEPIIDRL